MEFPHYQPLFSFRNAGDFDALRSVLTDAGFTDAGVLEVLDITSIPSMRSQDIPLLMRRTGGQPKPLNTLIRLFLIEAPCAVEAVQQAIDPMALETWVEAGLVEVHDTSVTATIKLLPFQGFWLAFDRTRILRTNLRHQYVMGIGKSTLTLANLTVRRHVRRTLDLGTGCGVHAFLAAPHSERVSATDVNPRSVQLAAFNAKLNGLSHVECLEGDLFEPVKGQTFDLVLANPPFVISPEKNYIYRDSGMEADEICRTIVRQVPAFLNEGGYCQILSNWVERSGRSWPDQLQGWFKGTGCDVLVIRSETRDPATYASTWIRHTEHDEPDEYARRFDTWVAYYEQHGIKAISAGLITIRRSDARVNWYRAVDGPERMLGPCGDAILQCFACGEFLETVRNDTDLLEQPLTVSPDVQLERRFAPHSSGWQEDMTRIHLTRGLAYSVAIDPYVGALITECDGTRRLKDLLTHMAVSLGSDPAEISTPFCAIARGLIERGFLLPTS